MMITREQIASTYDTIKPYIRETPIIEITAVDFQSIGKTTAILTFRSDLLGGLRLAHESAVL